MKRRETAEFPVNDLGLYSVYIDMIKQNNLARNKPYIVFEVWFQTKHYGVVNF